MKRQSIQKAAVALLFCSVICLPSFASAAVPNKATAPATVNNANTLKVSPVRSDVVVQPGSSTIVQTTVINLTNAPIALHPIENDFVAGDEKGTPSIVLDENSYAPTHSLKRFMVPLQNIVVAPGDAKIVPVTITVPKTAQPGGYYGAVRYAPVSSDSSKSVNLSASVASLILMTVPGPTTEQLALTNFDVQQNGGTGTNFRTSKDLTLLLRFANKGNLQEAPFGQIYIKKGSKVVFTNIFNQNEPKDNVLPDSARRWIIPLTNIGKFGKYTIGATLTYGTKNQSIEVTKTLWIVPTNYIYAGIGGLVGLIVLIFIIVFLLKSYKRKILRSSTSSRYRR